MIKIKSLGFNFTLRILDYFWELSCPTLADSPQRLRLRLVLLFIFDGFKPLAVMYHDVSFNRLKDDIVHLIGMAAFLWISGCEIENQVIESARVKLLDLVEQALQMVQLQPLFCFLPQTDGCIGSQRFTMWCPKDLFLIVSIPFVYLSHL